MSYRFLQVILIYILATGCKKEEIPIAKNFGYLTTRCRLITWFDPNSPFWYSAKYDSHNRIVGIDHICCRNDLQGQVPKDTFLHRVFEYENGELRRIIVPQAAASEFNPKPEEAWAEVEYEYGELGVVKVRQFEHDHNRMPDPRIERYRFELKYDKSEKPTEMISYVNLGDKVDDFRIKEKSKYEYDINGNLTRQISERDGLSTPDIIVFYYDKYPNTRKLLSYFHFGVEARAVPAVFSTNNVIGEQNDASIYGGIYYYGTYDNHHNMNDSGTMKWDCQ